MAGYATRLYPLTEKTPKALLDIAGIPMIERVIQKVLELDGIERIVVVSNHIFFSQFEDWAKKFRPETKIPIVVLDDGTTSNENRLGAIGDAQFAIEKAKINSEVVWVSGDNLFTFSLHDMQREFNLQKKDLIGCFDVRSLPEASKMGVIKLDSNRKVIDFVEKPKDPPSTLISCGIYFYTLNSVHRFKTYLDEGNSPDKPGEFVSWLHKETSVFGFVFDKPKDQWFDIGTLDVLHTVRETYSSHFW